MKNDAVIWGLCFVLLCFFLGKGNALCFCAYLLALYLRAKILKLNKKEVFRNLLFIWNLDLKSIFE